MKTEEAAPETARVTLRFSNPSLWKTNKERKQTKKDVFRQKAASHGHKLGSVYRWAGKGQERFRQQICKRCKNPAQDIFDQKCVNAPVKGGVATMVQQIVGAKREPLAVKNESAAVEKPKKTDKKGKANGTAQK